jgi:hypothetical protein
MGPLAAWLDDNDSVIERAELDGPPDPLAVTIPADTPSNDQVRPGDGMVKLMEYDEPVKLDVPVIRFLESTWPGVSNVRVIVSE